MKKIAYIVIFLFAVNIAKGQDFDISHYTFARDVMNPASFIQMNDMNAFVLYGNEFSGFNQGPNVLMADVSVKLNEYKLGLSVIGDYIGYDKTQYLKLRFARRFKISKKSYFSLGMNAGAIFKTFETTKMTFEDEDDPLSYADLNETNFDFSFGAEIQLDKLFVGFSADHLLKEFENEEDVTPISQYYTYAQYAVTTMRSVWFFPHVTGRYYKDVYYGELGIIALVNNKFWVGASYSMYHDLTAMTGLRIAKNILFGYAYKTNLNSELENPFITNTHEIFLSFSFNKDGNRIKSVRFID